MKKIVVPRERKPRETRVPLLPDAVKKLAGLGAAVQVEAGLGETVHVPDAAYRDAGAEVVADIGGALATADIVLRLNKPAAGPGGLRAGSVHVGFMDPFNDLDAVRAFAAAGISAVCMEMIPRTTLAQKMDALSSQASLAGYAAVLQAAARLPRCLPMMSTPAGTLAPCKVFVIGAGVAGLQAIATARRLGARVEAFDTRPVVEEQVQSLGAKFLKIDLGETGQTAGGYAKELTPEQLKRQQEEMGKACARADIVITTAKVFGRRAPRLLTAAQVGQMQPGSVVVDMAAGSGGNVEGSRPDEDVVVNGITIVGNTNLEGCVARDASQMYGSNLVNFIAHFWSREKKSFELRLDDEIMKGALVTHGGAVVHPMLKERMA